MIERTGIDIEAMERTERRGENLDALFRQQRCGSDEIHARQRRHQKKIALSVALMGNDFRAIEALAAKPDKSLGFVGELAKRSGLFDLQVKPRTPFALQTKNTGRGPPESVPSPFIAA